VPPQIALQHVLLQPEPELHDIKTSYVNNLENGLFVSNLIVRRSHHRRS